LSQGVVFKVAEKEELVLQDRAADVSAENVLIETRFG
jgi:hypothetical protein